MPSNNAEKLPADLSAEEQLALDEWLAGLAVAEPGVSNRLPKSIKKIIINLLVMTGLLANYTFPTTVSADSGKPNYGQLEATYNNQVYLPDVGFTPKYEPVTEGEILAYENLDTRDALLEYFPNLEATGVMINMPDYDASRTTLDVLRYWLRNWSFKLARDSFFDKYSEKDHQFREKVTRVEIDLSRQSEQAKVPQYVENEDGTFTLHLSIGHGHPEQIAGIWPYLVAPEQNVYQPSHTYFTYAGISAIYEIVANRKWVEEDQQRIDKGHNQHTVVAPYKDENGEIVISPNSQQFVDYLRSKVEGQWAAAIQNSDSFLPAYTGLGQPQTQFYPSEMQLIGQYNPGEHQYPDNDFYDAFVHRVGDVWVAKLLTYFENTDQVIKFMQLVYHKDAFSAEELSNIDPQVMAAYNHAVEVGLIPDKEEFNKFLEDDYLYPNGNDGQTATNGVAFARLNGEFSDTVSLDLFGDLIDLESGKLDNRELWHFVIAPFVHLYIPVETAEGVNWYRVGRILHRDNSRDFTWMINISGSVFIPGIGTYDLEGKPIVIEAQYNKDATGAFSYINYHFGLTGHFASTQTSDVSDEQLIAEPAVDPLLSE